jgi:hypothetical protein
LNNQPFLLHAKTRWIIAIGFSLLHIHLSIYFKAFQLVLQICFNAIYASSQLSLLKLYYAKVALAKHLEKQMAHLAEASKNFRSITRGSWQRQILQLNQHLEPKLNIQQQPQRQ